MADENKLSNKSGKSINDASLDPLSGIKNLRLRNINKVIIIDNTNINSFPNKFEQFKELVMKDIDVLVIIIVIRTERWKHGPYNASHSIIFHGWSLSIGVQNNKNGFRHRRFSLQG